MAISTGIPEIDTLLGTGGLPRGRIVELFGPPSCGKTTLSLHWIAALQRVGGNAVFIDAEHALDPAWLAACGVDGGELPLLKPASGEQALQMAESLLGTFAVDLVVLDSAAALYVEETPAAAEDVPHDAHSEFLYRCLRRLNLAVQRTRACLLVLNQLRSGGTDLGEERSASSRPLSLHSAIRLRMEADGPRWKLTTVKNKLAEPFGEVSIELQGANLRTIARKPAVRAGEARAAVAGVRTASKT